MTVVVPANSPVSSGTREPRALVVRPAHLATLVQQVTEKHASARVIAVQVPGTWTGGGELAVGTQTWQIARADSVLAVREQLAMLEDAGADARLIILTRLETQELGWDVIARLTRLRVHVIEGWELLRDLFRAHQIDPRIAGLGWLADVLLDGAPVTGYPPTPSGVLDLDRAWQHALGGLLGLQTGAPDALTLLRWSTGPSVTRWSTLGEEARLGVAKRFEETAGSMGRVLAQALDARQGARLLSLGLACDVLWPEVDDQFGSTRESLVAARVRMEPLVGGSTLNAGVARAWAGHARRVLGELPADRVGAEHAKAGDLLRELRAEEALGQSQVLPEGAARRGVTFARAITDWLSERGSATGVVDAQREFVAHADVARDSARVARAAMAVRLVRAMSGSAPAPVNGFGALVRHHVQWWSWIDAARTALFGGEVNADLSAAYGVLLESAGVLRESETKRFADCLVQWNVRPTAEPDVIPVERVLELIAGPISQTRDVLVLLLDGLELNVWRRLLSDVAARGWTWWQPTTATIAPVGIATLPSVTAASRASFFAGKVRSGDRSTEREDFAEHPALRRSGSQAPLLFHKGELGAANALASNIRDAISSRQRVVGAVVNAVDDWLSRSDQTIPPWSLSEIPLLEQLFHVASAANRVVIIASDHGHILDFNNQQLGRGEGARWRLPTSEPARSGEIVASGPRVRDAVGHESIVLAVSEKIRYAGKQAGYHGGVTPQEIIAPIAVLSRGELGIDGWRPVVDAAPAWWHDPLDHVVAGTPLVRSEPALAPPPMSGGPSPSRAVPGWIEAVLSSTVYATQKNLAGRMAPRDEQMQTVLAILDRYQGRAPRAVVAAELALPDVRMRGLLANIRRVLNVEGFAVLEEEESTATVLLNRALLDVQFGITTDRGIR